jgi:DNA mismatch repair ATPase MutS
MYFRIKCFFNFFSSYFRCPQVCFLYQLTAGACPKSYGHNVARLAGLPASVVAHAAMKAAELESVFRERASALAPASTANEAAATAASGADERRNDAAIVGDVIKLQAVLSAVGNGSMERVLHVWKGLSADGRAN